MAGWALDRVAAASRAPGPTTAAGGLTSVAMGLAKVLLPLAMLAALAPALSSPQRTWEYRSVQLEAGIDASENDEVISESTRIKRSPSRSRPSSAPPPQSCVPSLSPATAVHSGNCWSSN